MKVTTSSTEILISLEKNAINLKDVQRFIDFLRLKEITYKSRAGDDDVENMANEINEDWYKNNKK